MQEQRHMVWTWLLAIFVVLGVASSSEYTSNPYSVEHFVSHHHFASGGADHSDDPEEGDSITIPLVPDAASPLLVVGVSLLLMTVYVVRRRRFRKPDFLHLEVCPFPD